MRFVDVPAWDVAATVAYALLRIYIGIDHAWPIVVLLALSCSLDRDMQLHEMVQGLYMLRYTCNSVHLKGSPAYIMCVLAVGLSIWARSTRYQRYGHVVRRAVVSTSIFLAVLVRYDWNMDPVLSVIRLAAYVAATRVSVTHYKLDSWDAALQAMWLFVVPIYAYVLVVFQILVQYGTTSRSLHRAEEDRSTLV